jgi:hypothetical protein
MIFIMIGLVVAGLCAIDAVHAGESAAPMKHKKAAISKKKVSSRVTKARMKSKAASGELQTDVKFDDSVLHGQYQTPEEALARVENEKGLSDLLGVRKHFKDRLATASEQE